MNEINEIKIPEGIDRISVKQHDDKIVIEFIPEEAKFKEGDFVYEDGRIIIVKNYPNNYYAIIYPKLNKEIDYNRRYASDMTLSSLPFRYATEEEKQLLIDALAEVGKRWNAEKKCIEDIPKRKFKAGDKVRIKDGISSRTHRNVGPGFMSEMDNLIGKTMTVSRYTHESGYIICNEYGWHFHEDWLEPWNGELKKGDLAIFWDDYKDAAIIKRYDRKEYDYHCDSFDIHWGNAIKFESKEQYEKMLRGGI